MKIKICWIFFPPNHLFLRSKNEKRPKTSSSSAPSFHHRFVTYKRTQHTHLQNGPFDAIRFSWQANYREQGFLQTVRVFDLRVMESRVELRLSFCFVLFLRSSLVQRLGEIEGNPPPPLTMMFLYSHSPLLLSSSSSSSKQRTVRSTRRSSKRPTCRKSSPRRPSLRPPPPRCSHRYVSFFFSLVCLFWSCLVGGFKTGIKNTSLF